MKKDLQQGLLFIGLVWLWTKARTDAAMSEAERAQRRADRAREEAAEAKRKAEESARKAREAQERYDQRWNPNWRVPPSTNAPAP